MSYLVLLIEETGHIFTFTVTFDKLVQI